MRRRAREIYSDPLSAATKIEARSGADENGEESSTFETGEAPSQDEEER